MEEALPKLLETVFLFLPRIGASLVVVLVFWLLSAIAGNLVARIGKRTRLAGDVISLLARAGKVALIIFGIVTALGTVGINISALVAGLGLTGFALGFALKDALSNMLAGVLILSYRPFRHGQRIEFQATKARSRTLISATRLCKRKRKRFSCPMQISLPTRWWFFVIILTLLTTIRSPRTLLHPNLCMIRADTCSSRSTRRYFWRGSLSDASGNLSSPRRNKRITAARTKNPCESFASC